MAPDSTTRRDEPEIIECEAEPMDRGSAQAGGRRPDTPHAAPRFRIVRFGGVVGWLILIGLFFMLFKLGGLLLGGLASLVANPRALLASLLAIAAYVLWRRHLRGRA